MKRNSILLVLLLGVVSACTDDDSNRKKSSRPAPTAPAKVIADEASRSQNVAPAAVETPPAAQDEPKKALAITDPNVVPYGVRARLTRGTWDYLRLLLRDTFKQWGSPRRDDVGINLLLDPGYNYGTHSAGAIRTTPFERYWAYQPGHGCTFEDCNSNNLYSVKSGTGQWIQNRAYQAAGQMCNANNTVNGNARGLPNADLQGLHREHGYYVTTGDQCFSEIEVCTPVCSQTDICTPHVGHNPAQVCDMAAINTDTLGIMAEINLGVFVYPHGGVESMPTPLETYNPPDLGTYTGFTSRYGMRTAGARTVSTGCGFFGTCSGSTAGWSWAASGFPAAAANYDPFFVHHKDTGSYFRAGDDQAIYLNIGQMQVQSLARGGAANMWYQLKDQQSGLCLAVSAGGTANDTAIILEVCDTASPQAVRQMFQYDYQTGYLRARVAPATSCVSFASAADGAAIRLFTCTGDATHITVFDRPGDKFRNNVPDIVVEAHPTVNTADQQVFVGTAAQNWAFVDSGDASSKWQQWKDNDDGTCVDLSGANLVHIACNAASLGQYWIYNPGDKSFRSALDFNMCIDANGTSDGTQVMVKTCSSPTVNNYQRWTRFLVSGTTYWIRSDQNTAMCLNGDTGSSKVQLYSDGWLSSHCADGPAAEEKFSMLPGAIAYGWVRDRDGSKCLAVPSLVQTNGTVVAQGACIINDYYQWLFDQTNGYIRLKANPNKCLDHGGVNTPGSALRIYDCGGARANLQRFDRQGEIIYVRNGFYLTGGVTPPTMRYSKTDNSQMWQQINDKSVVITYSPSMHDCGDSAGNDKIYSGTRDANNEPVYFDALTPQCIRPKSYWVAAKNRWVPCDPFDSYMADGTFNPDRDDNTLIYPAPFGGQTRTCGVATSIYDPGLDSGWYGFKIDSLDLKSDATATLADKNSIVLTLSTKDLRFEAGMWIDVNLVGGVSGLVSDPKRRWALLNAHAKNLVARPKIKLYSIDSDSCQQAGGGGGCTDFWYPYNNQIQDPDRLVVDVELTKADIDLPMDTPGFSIVSAPSCFVSVIGICAMTTATLLDTVMAQLSDVIKGVLIPLIQDAVKGAVNSIPELNDVMGNPMNLGRSLIDVGLYATPDYSVYLPDPTLPEPPRKWPIRIFDGPAVGREITDLRFAVGMKPIAFKLPVVPTGFVTVDPNDPPCVANDARPGCTVLPNPTVGSIYGVPTLVDPNTSACFNAKGTNYAHRILINGASYSYNNSSGVMTMTFTNGSYAAFRAGYVIRDISTGKTAVVKSVQGGSITLPAGLSTSFNGNDFEVAIGVMSGMVYTTGSTPILVVGQVFRDDNTLKATKIIEIRGAEILTENFSTADFNTGAFTIFNCSRVSQYPTPDTDQEIDADDYVLTGSFTDPNTGIVYAAPKVVPEYWKGPIDINKREPSWCATPNELRQYSTPAKFAQLYPQTTWLSFDSVYDKKFSNQAAGPKNTIGGWDQMPAGSVLRQNDNTGLMELGPVTYDFSLHVHQRTLASLLQAVIASGSACLEFAAQDTTGADTPWKSLLLTDRFAAFIPELATLFPGQYVSVRIFPTRAPHVRTGVGNLTFNPKDTSNGPLKITNEKYTMGIAFPDLRIEFWVQNPKTNVELRVLSMYWNTVLGFFAKNVRACYKLDPLFGTPECNSPQVNVRTVSGYYELFFDLNAPSLQSAFENATDGFAVGSFSTPGLGTAKGQAAIMIDSTICQTPGKCKLIGLAQSVPSLMSSLLQVFLVTRLQFMNMALDFVYVGPDGPSDDGVPGGDYLAIYARLLGNLNVFDLIGSVSLAPGYERLPLVTMGGFENTPELVFNNNAPIIPIVLTNRDGDGRSVNSYTYSVNDGFWHTPVNTDSITLDVLTEGEHKLSVRTINDSDNGAVAQKLPTELRFRVDTVAPEITFGSSEGWGWWRHIPVKLTDLQTPSDKITATYSIDGGKKVELEDGEIPLSRLSSGRNVVRVYAFDDAGNEGNAAKEIVVGSGCSTSQPADGMLILFAVMLSLLGMRRQWRRHDR